MVERQTDRQRERDRGGEIETQRGREREGERAIYMER